MHFSTATYLCSVFSLLAIQPVTLASPTPDSAQDVTFRTSSTRACHRGTYDSQSLCTINCGTGTSAGNCTRINTMLVNDSPPYDCTCPGDTTALIDNDQSHTQPVLRSQQQQPQSPPLRKAHPRWLSAQNLQLQARAAQQQHQKWFVENARQQQQQQPRAVREKTPRCHRGYHKNMDTCMANCGAKSGNCISFQHVDGGIAVACQCKPGEL